MLSINPIVPVLQGLSPSRELLMNLNSQGWTLQELADAAKQAGVLSVVQILSTYCEDEGEACRGTTVECLCTGGTLQGKTEVPHFRCGGGVCGFVRASKMFFLLRACFFFLVQPLLCPHSTHGAFAIFQASHGHQTI